MEQWGGNLAKMIEEEQTLIQTTASGFYPYLWEIYPVKNIVLAKFSADNILRRNISKSVKTHDYSKTKSNFHINIKQLMSDLKFKNLRASVNIGIMASANQSKDLRAQIESVISFINSEFEERSKLHR